MSGSSAEEVTIITGIVRIRGSLFIICRTSSPFTFGNFRSNKTTFGEISVRRPRIYRAQTGSPKLLRHLPHGKAGWRGYVLFNARIVNSASRGLSSTSRTSTISLSFMIILLPRHGKIKGCAFVHFTFRPNLSTVPANNSLNNRQTYACAFEFAFAMQSLEDPE